MRPVERRRASWLALSSPETLFPRGQPKTDSLRQVRLVSEAKPSRPRCQLGAGRTGAQREHSLIDRPPSGTPILSAPSTPSPRTLCIAVPFAVSATEPAYLPHTRYTSRARRIRRRLQPPPRTRGDRGDTATRRWARPSRQISTARTACETCPGLNLAARGGSCRQSIKRSGADRAQSRRMTPRAAGSGR